MSISARDRRMYALAMRVAETSECEDKHGAVLAQGARVIRVAVNTDASGRHGKPTQHAESRLFPWCPMEYIGTPPSFTVYSARFHAFTMSKPCDECQETLQENDVSRVVWHDGWTLREFKR